jgi:trk system potassium uptake protein TrkH
MIMKIPFSPGNILSRYLSPSGIFVLSFAMVILLGTIFLYLPFSESSGYHITIVDALFTATSAVCVTGLTVVDVGKDLSLTGQIFTLILFQIGGLGIITFSTVFFGLMGRSISFSGREILRSTFLHTPRRDFFAVAKWVLVSTLIIEGVGTFFLFVRFIRDFSAGKALYQAVYHAVSAFNNCGYSLFSDNLMRYQSDIVVNLTVMGLIVVGGIGFIVQYEIISWINGFRKKFSIHTKIVLITTTALILSGAILFYLFEMNNILKGASFKTSVLTSFFQSITPRTCGFNTVHIGQLTNATILIIVLFMFIGASPGSTGGGIKTTSFALLMLMIWNRFKGMDGISVFNRTIPREILTRMIAIIVASAFFVGLVTMMLLFAGGTPSELPIESRHWLIEYLFETVSAFGTVGLSMGITTKMNDFQKIAIVLMMFAGRVGPLTLAFAWSSKKKSIRYAEESVMVG